MTSYLLIQRPNAESPFQPLLDLGESGPGFQDVAVDVANDPSAIPQGEYLVFNAELFIPVQQRAPPQCPTYAEFIAALGPQLRYTLSRQVRLVSAPAAPIPLPPPHLVIPPGAPLPRGTLVVPARTSAGEVYVRMSAYANDHRVTSDRGVVAGTYSTTSADAQLVTTGLGAVGRYALPNPFPANFVFEIRPEPGTEVLAGTTRPAFGQAGGGVEVVFHKGASPWSVSQHAREMPSF